MSSNDTSPDTVNVTMTPLDTTAAVELTSPSTTATPAPLTTTTVLSTTTSMMSTTTTTMGTTTVINTLFGLSMSNTVLITVFTGCTALILLVVLCICCRLLCMKSKRQSTDDREHPQAVRTRSNRNHYADPYRVVENHYHSNDVTKLHYATPDITYAKPEIYSTFINPSFYEDVYARWRLQEQARHEKTYDSPWQYSRRTKEPSQTGGVVWSAQSLQALDNYDYDRYSRIPRGKLTSESERDEVEAVPIEQQSFTTF